jgi:hypothetical protein
MLTTPADKWFSLCVRERAEWKCERCHHQYSYPDTSQGLDCAHYQTRDEWATRLEPLDAMALCRGCHEYFDKERRFEFENFYKSIFGADGLALLREKALDPGGYGKEIKRTKGKGEISKHYRLEYRRMLQLRANGVVGRIDFQGWA